MNKAYDVVVVGAGVAGLYASLRLASMGWNVALVESKPTNAIGSKVCGDALGVHHLNELDLTVPEAVIDHKYRGVKLYSPSKNYSIIVPGEGVSLNRLKFGQWLLKQALDNGVELLDRHVAFDVVLKENRVKGIKVKKVDSEVLELEAKLFIDASGYRPAIRSKLPREWPISERPYVSDYNIAYREIVEVEGRIIDENTANYALIYL
ncbi:MAG: FAD-dependent oxidoreductase, partial [Desulfurococcaceae archaeon]